MHCVDLGESFQTHIFLQHLASMQQRTSPVKFARSPRTDPPGVKVPAAQKKPLLGLIGSYAIRITICDLWMTTSSYHGSKSGDSECGCETDMGGCCDIFLPPVPTLFKSFGFPVFRNISSFLSFTTVAFRLCRGFLRLTVCFRFIQVIIRMLM